eukprot:COSAG04_NODE_177_length_21403_cov_37.154807_10_plen_116_part_00
MKAENEAQLKEMEKLRAEAAEAKMLALKAETAAEVQAAKAEAERSRLRDQQLVALQARLDALHQAKLLGDEEVFVVEDIIADCDAHDDQVSALLSLSAKMVTDKAFARQLRRKYA